MRALQRVSPAAALWGALGLMLGCDRTLLATSDASCNGRIGFAPCEDQGATGDGGAPRTLVPDAPPPSAPPATCTAQFGFEDGTVQGFQDSTCCGIQVGAFENTTERAWCGQHALKMTFESTVPDLSVGGPTVHVSPTQSIDLRGKTLVARIYVEGPVGGRLYGLLSVTGPLASLMPGPLRGLPAGRWSELSLTFGGLLPVMVTDVALEILGADFTGSATIYLDEVGW